MANKLPFDLAKINALLSPASMRQFNAFLEQLPARFGLNLLIVAAIVWGCAAVLVFYTSIQARDLFTLRAELLKTDALLPQVPQLTKVPVTQEELDGFVKVAKAQFPGLEVTATNNTLAFKAPSNVLFGRFREAIFQSFNSGKNWRADLATLCLGRECVDKGGFLLGSFNVSRFTVTPATNTSGNNETN